jgi:hypothetical protein
MLHALLRRPPVMICPRCTDTRSQPIAIAEDAAQAALAAG